MRETHGKCGIVAIHDYRVRNNVTDTYEYTRKLKHRGQHACGHLYIQEGTRENTLTVVTHNGSIEGLEKKLHEAQRVPCTRITAGHTQYRTSGPHETEVDLTVPDPCSAQPMASKDGSLAILWNGNLPDPDIRRKDESVDTQTLLRLIEESVCQSQRQDMTEVMSGTFRNIEQMASGAFNIAVVHRGDPENHTPASLFAYRDRRGTRPFGYTTYNGQLLVASENRACPYPDAVWRDIPPGHMINSLTPYPEPQEVIPADKCHCFFEWTYFAHVTSRFDGIGVAEARNHFGRILAQGDRGAEFTANKQGVYVVPVPDSAKAGAAGYADELKIPTNTDAITRNPAFLGRKFIDQGSEGKKHMIHEDEIHGKTLIVVEDSFVRGDTIIDLIDDLLRAHPKEIHLRFCSPPFLGPCYKGIDIRSSNELFIPKLFNYQVPPFDKDGCLPQRALERIAQALHVDSVRFLPIPGVPEALRMEQHDLCISCVDCQYNTEVERRLYDLDLKKVRTQQT